MTGDRTCASSTTLPVNAGNVVGRPSGAERQQRQKGEGGAAQNFTFGGACASGVVVNSAIGLFFA